MGVLSYKGKDFYMDGKPFYILSGAMHYFRIPREYWRDRLLKLKECGFNTVETYTCWNLHEPEEGRFDFSGGLDIEEYIKTAAELGLYVILRPGPYICAEWEFGGLPAWILRHKNMRLRCNDSEFLSLVERYYTELLSRVRPHLAANGGNIIMLQVENEYGSYGDDKEYLRAVAEIYRKNGMDCLYFTSDGTNPTMLTGGTLPEYLCVANFGSNPADRIGKLDAFRPDQPSMCGEFWGGWFDHWFEEHHTGGCESNCADLEYMLKNNVSVNFYMFHGGTNFGFTNGANHIGFYQPTVTSYDYDAPLSEAGDRTESYYGFREVIKKHFGSVPELTAKETEKCAYGTVSVTETAPLFDNLSALSTPVRSAAPQFMEDLGQNFGYILYRTTVQGEREPQPLMVDPLHDRAQIFVDGEHKATYYRATPPTDEDAYRFGVGKGREAKLDVLMENMGRINYGPLLLDRKGTESIRFGNYCHFGWDIYPLPMDDLSKLSFVPVDKTDLKKPAFYRAALNIEGEPKDTFLRLSGWGKGFVTVNGTNIGRYFNAAGPQKTLYVPAPFLRSGENEIIVFESDGTASTMLEFLDTPDLG